MGLRILRWGQHPRIPRWAQNNHMTVKEKGKKRVRGDVKQGEVRATPLLASRYKEPQAKESRSPLEAREDRKWLLPWRHQKEPSYEVSPGDHWTFVLQNCKLIDPRCFRPRVCSHFITATIRKHSGLVPSFGWGVLGTEHTHTHTHTHTHPY
jgi:hypothetical protein